MQIEYFHIELDDHDVIFADGAPAETFVDCDNRLMFQNGAEYVALHPADGRPRWRFCLPRLELGSERLIALRAGLLERAAMFGHVHGTDPDLHLIIDGAVVRPARIDGLTYRFEVPASSAAVRLASRSIVPAQTTAQPGDLRRLGVAVERFVLGDANRRIEVLPGHPGLRHGFHEDEGTHRWTDGVARLPSPLLRRFARRVHARREPGVDRAALLDAAPARRDRDSRVTQPGGCPSQI
jgi:hypothetical protein